MGCVQRHAGLGSTRAQERLGDTPAAVVVAAHDEADAACVQQRHQPGGRIAAVEHQHIVGAEQIQCLDEHVALGYCPAVHAGVQGQLRLGQEQCKQALVGLGHRATEQARPQRRHQQGGVCGDHPQAAPALNQAGLIGTANEQIIEPDQRGMCRRSRALANARSETARSKDSLPHTEAKKPSNMVCWDGLRVLSVSSGVFA